MAAWVLPAIAAGTTILGKLLDKGESSGAETTTNLPSYRTPEAQKIWDEFMAKLLGGQGSEGGLESVLQGQAGYLEPKVQEYTGLLSDLINNQGVGTGLLSPTTINLGGQGGFSFVPRSNQQAAQLLANLGGQKLQTETQYAPGWENIKYLDYLNPLAMNTESLRYSMPTSTSSANLQLPQPGILSYITGGTEIAKAVKDILPILFPE